MLPLLHFFACSVEKGVENGVDTSLEESADLSVDTADPEPCAIDTGTPLQLQDIGSIHTCVNLFLSDMITTETGGLIAVNVDNCANGIEDAGVSYVYETPSLNPLFRVIGTEKDEHLGIYTYMGRSNNSPSGFLLTTSFEGDPVGGANLYDGVSGEPLSQIQDHIWIGQGLGLTEEMWVAGAPSADNNAGRLYLFDLENLKPVLTGQDAAAVHHGRAGWSLGTLIWTLPDVDGDGLGDLVVRVDGDVGLLSYDDAVIDEGFQNSRYLNFQPSVFPHSVTDVTDWDGDGLEDIASLGILDDPYQDPIRLYIFSGVAYDPIATYYLLDGTVFQSGEASKIARLDGTGDTDGLALVKNYPGSHYEKLLFLPPERCGVENPDAVALPIETDFPMPKLIPSLGSDGSLLVVGTDETTIHFLAP